MIAKTRSTLNEGKTSIGSWMQIPDSSIAEIMGRAGYSWVVVDMEHGAFSRQTVADIFRALELGGTLPFARVSRVHPNDIKIVLDAGARGLILPMIETGDQLTRGISWARYPPQGTRGVGYCRANMFGQYFDVYAENANKLLIVAQIEHIRGVKNIDDILRVEGLDAIMVGPYDLSGSLNLTAQFDHPHFLQVMDEIHLKAKEFKIPMGLHLVQPDRDELEAKIAEGYQFIAYGIDAVFLYRAAARPEVDEVLR